MYVLILLKTRKEGERFKITTLGSAVGDIFFRILPTRMMYIDVTKLTFDPTEELVGSHLDPKLYHRALRML